jgi:putative endonuclease
VGDVIFSAAAREKGRSGEDLARARLSAKGYRFLRANYRTRGGEVDLIMERGDTVVFVEVKARGDGEGQFGTPQESVTPAKQRRIVLAALHYVKAAGAHGRPLRFDVFAISPSGTEHIENAFVPEAGLYTV